jgi:predicted GH43/DUF377 family glycosyl hydrolase
LKYSNHLDETRRALLKKFAEDVERGLEPLAELLDIEAVVGIPFYDEDDTIPGVVQTARMGLARAGLSGKSIVICVGPYGSLSALDAALTRSGPDHGVPVHGFLHSRDLKGPGCCKRAILEAASRLDAPLVLLPPDLIPQPRSDDVEGQGFSMGWILRLLAPVREFQQDLALPRFSHDPLARAVESLFVYPLVTGVFGFRLRQPIPGVQALSTKLVRACLSASEFWSEDPGTYGFEAWLVTQAIAEEFAVCEVPLGAAEFEHRIGRIKTAFRQVTHALHEQVIIHSNWWLKRPDPIFSPRVSGAYLDVAPMRIEIELKDLLRRFKFEFNHFDNTLLCEIVSEELRKRMERLADTGPNGAALTAEEWIKVLCQFLLAYRFDKRFHPDDIVDALFPFFLARLAGYIYEVRQLEDDLTTGDRPGPIIIDRLVRHEAEKILERQADMFVSGWPGFRQAWHDREAEAEPYLPKLVAWEFVPHVGVIVPQELEKSDGSMVRASEIYQKLIDQYRMEFMWFLHKHLGLQEATYSSEILARIQNLMNTLNWLLDTKVFPYDLSSVDGAQKMTDVVFNAFADELPLNSNGSLKTKIKGITFQLTPESAEKILKQVPPRNLIMLLGCGNVGGLLEEMEPCDALGMASWTDRQLYLEHVLDIIDKEGNSSWFHLAPLKPIVLDPSRFGSLTELRGITALARLSGRIVVGSMQKGWGGEYPKLWFLLTLAKTIAGSEMFSSIWQGFAEQKRDFASRLTASIRGRWGRHVLSAHNAFENSQQRIVAERLKQFAENIGKDSDKTEAAQLLKAIADVYHLSITLPDATFVPLSAWTWTSYSSRGGFGAPTPLSSLVERDWATRDFLTAYLEEAGYGDEQTINDKIVELIGQGRESDNLRDHLLGRSADADELMVRQVLSASPPAAVRLLRPVEHPILEPVTDHKWESQYVLNAASVRLDGRIYILYRAYGEDKISRIGLAWTKDGIHIDGRLNKPIFEPQDSTESAGTEDPRVTQIGDRLYMLYTAWNEQVAQIAMASIPVELFIEHRFEAWQRHGLGFPELPNKDAVLYPEKFNGRYVIYHRIDPNLWISYLDNLTCPWPRTGQKIVTGPRPGMMWDGIKVGAGAQPIKTKYGWLNIYHGVDYERTYRLGVLFMALDDPTEIIYQSPNPILEPETDFEIGKTANRDYWVPHVVFTCGAVPAVEKDVIDLDDEIFVYYGAADTSIGVAKGKLRDLVPVLNGKKAKGSQEW